jgi:hypothetical protein
MNPDMQALQDGLDDAAEGRMPRRPTGDSNLDAIYSTAYSEERAARARLKGNGRQEVIRCIRKCAESTD